MENPPQIWVHGDDGNQYERIDRAVEHFSGESLTPAERRTTTIADRALLIYTSGTTGLPKAANVSHRRLLQWSFWFAGLMNTGPGDRMYDCLPMYHSVGGVVATGAVLVRGGLVLIRDKFSARRFWDDIAEWDCTLFQYIGELARYLLNAPQAPRERAHRLRLCCGNGLRADVWEKFQKRFAIPRIIEFYAATEGNVSLYNVEGKIGAVGRVPPFLASRLPLALVKFDAAAGEPARDGGGFCTRCAINETGEAIAKIPQDASQSAGVFEGYTERKDTEQEILRNVFQPGDAWFRTGDLMRMDETGFFYFVDRIGDTFRWKGENVATTEVAAAMTAFAGVKDATVYGVRVTVRAPPAWRRSSRVGPWIWQSSASILRSVCRTTHGPDSCASPASFRRLRPSRHSKTELQRNGFDPATTNDPIYFDDTARNAFVPLDSALYARIAAGTVRV
jgi:fatty-acyl-CoA synthase